ncbi:MAG: IS1595 family transposase [Gammaproteobacteria bacterium]|nr:IS1595 family transposase [Gammaproteobacteria bacterium]
MADVNLISLIDRFNCDDKCREALEQARWPHGVCCTRCGDMDVTELPKHNRWQCKGCGYQFSVTSGTIMHDSHLPLRKWFLAIYLMCESKKGMSANQLHRSLGIAYRTAWYLCHRIREAMGNKPLEGPTLVGVVEVDETWVGGKVKGKGRRYTGNKTIIAGAIQRDGKVRMERIPNTKKATLHDFIKRTVRDEAEAIYTDELKSYLGIEDHNTRHETVNHSQEQWVVGDVHTNSIEGVWALFKRSLTGTFHKMSKKHMDRYIEELEWRFNNRDNDHIFRDTLVKIMNTPHIEYKDLVA